VTRNGRERTVMIAIEEYRRLKPSDRQVLSLSTISRMMTLLPWRQPVHRSRPRRSTTN